jgi:fructose-1,6-bisphosphatase/inositol monophosphatase family enzyme
MIELHVGYYDIAAGLVILKEAGGRSSSLDGTEHPQHSIIAANGILYEWYKEAVDTTIGSVLF